MNKTIIVYHDQCHDGITALWSAKKAFPNAEVYAGDYNKVPDTKLFQDKAVLLVDFSYKKELLLEIQKVALSLLVIDHHKTAFEELGSLPFCIFDMNKSGAGLTWDTLVGGQRPALIDYVEDRDLWRFKLPYCKAVHASCDSYPLTLEAREMLMERSIQDLITEGLSIIRYHDKLVESALKNVVRMDFEGYNVPAISCPIKELASDLGNRMAINEHFAIIYRDLPSGERNFSLRSTDAGVDVSAIARKFNGGGHRNASGFTIKMGALENGTY